MSTYNIEMNMLNNSNGYDVLYPNNIEYVNFHYIGAGTVSYIIANFNGGISFCNRIMMVSYKNPIPFSKNALYKMSACSLYSAYFGLDRNSGEKFGRLFYKGEVQIWKYKNAEDTTYDEIIKQPITAYAQIENKTILKISAPNFEDLTQTELLGELTSIFHGKDNEFVIGIFNISGIY